MKIDATIKTANDIGDHLELTFVGEALNDTLYSPMRGGTLRVPLVKNAGRIYYVGRRVTISIEPVA
jgi:hypothetical protein